MRGPHIFFAMAKTGKRVTAAWWGVPLAILILILGQTIGGIVFFGLMAAGLVGADGPGLDQFDLMMQTMSSADQGIFLLTTFVFIALLTFLWVKVFEGRTIVSMGFSLSRKGLMQFLRGSGLALLVMTLIAFGMEAGGIAEREAAQIPQSWLAVWPLLLLLIGWIVQGSTEEILDRGLLFQSAGARHGLIAAIIISSTFFSVMHGLNSNPSLLFFINLALYAVFVCFYALREASLWGVCGYHAIWNFAQGNLYGFAVSGEQFGSDRLFSFVETGPDFITGGATGPEGGLVTTIALIVSTVVFLVTRPDPQAKALADAAKPEQTAADGSPAGQ